MGCSPSQDRVNKGIKKIKKGSLKIKRGQFIVFNDRVFSEVYCVGRSLGSGTFGEVKFCIQLSSNSHKAVKIFKKDELMIDVYRKKFEKEIEILKTLDKKRCCKKVSGNLDRHGIAVWIWEHWKI